MPYLKIALSTDTIALDNIRYSNKLESVAEKIDTDIVLESAKYKKDLPDSLLARKQFWQNWADRGTQTILVITPWLQNTVKAQYQREALEANIAILLLRDGIVQTDEFEDTVAELVREKIAVDLLGVRKSGAGRMATLPFQSKFLIDASPGTAILSSNGDTFRIVTSQAKAGGSARPLQVVRDCGNAPLDILARQLDRLCMLNPASAYAYSRLPNVIHFADKMAKTVQRIEGVSFLQGVNRQKIFFV